MRKPDIDHLKMEHCFRGPKWRYLLAERYTGQKAGSIPDEFDQLTQETVDYLRLCQLDGSGPDWAARKYPLIAAAFKFIQNEKVAERFKLSILGNLPLPEIAERLGVDEDVLATARELFFDLTGMRHAASWMACQVFIPETKAGNPDLAARMKIAFHRGPVGARAVLDAHDDLPMKEAQRLVNQEMLLHSKAQAALELELTEENSLKYLKLFTSYDIARKKLEFEREQFRYECELAQVTREAEAANDIEGGKGDAEDQHDDAPDDACSERPSAGAGQEGVDERLIA